MRPTNHETSASSSPPRDRSLTRFERHDAPQFDQQRRLISGGQNEIPLSEFQPREDYETGYNDHEYAGIDSRYSRPSSHHGSESHLAPSKIPKRKFKRYPARATLNTLGPVLVLVFYLYIVFEYMLRPPHNDIIANSLIPAKGVFYAWVILSIFVLDWAKSGLAGFEAAALMKPRLAPANAMRLMWHADRAWGNVSGWYKAVLYGVHFLGHRSNNGRSTAKWNGPGMLWCYLAVSSLLFYIAVPLSGISMDIDPAFKLSDHRVTILGVNESTFALATNDAIQTTAENAWRVGDPASPVAPTIFYGPQDAKNVSNTFYDDAIQKIYQADLANQSQNTNRTITFFSGPRVAERAHGSAWGLLTSISCAAVNPQNGLQLIRDVHSVNNWTTDWLTSSTFNASSTYAGYYSLGLEPVSYLADTSYGMDFKMLIASDRDVLAIGNTDYGNATQLPIRGSFEMLLWQLVESGFPSDSTLQNMTSNPVVMSSESADNNLTYLGYGVRCEVSSDTGFADLNVRQSTFSNFRRQAALIANIDLTATGSAIPIPEYPGPFAIQSIVLGAISKLTLGYMGPPSCLPGGDHICNVFFGANTATGGFPALVNLTNSDFGGQALRMPAISPERMTYAMYKLFGQTAAAMMQVGPSNWTAELRGLEPTNGIVPGKVPWQLVLALLIIWALLTITPQLWVFFEKRWSSTFEAFELFKFGAEFKEAVETFEGNEFTENGALSELPGLIGDLEPTSKTGFVGLSRYPASSEKDYTSTRRFMD